VAAIPDERPDQAAGRMLSAGELAALLSACAADPTPAGVRDALIIGLGAYGGLRRHEMAGLHVENLDASGKAIQVRGKRSKVRQIPLTGGLCGALEDWLHVRGRHPGWLLTAIDKSGRLGHAGLSDQAVYELMEKRRLQAGVSPFTPHDLRRTFISELLDAGADIATVQKLVGHASANTTSGYDRRGENAKRSAVGKLHMGWQRRY
jgi:integrase